MEALSAGIDFINGKLVSTVQFELP
ncbi:Protein of unknown function [Bacillus mycoides]|nr:Protein of unknown function [Bacillus mycoides]